MFTVKTYKPDGTDGATVRGLTWLQMTSLKFILEQHGIKYFVEQVEIKETVSVSDDHWYHENPNY